MATLNAPNRGNHSTPTKKTSAKKTQPSPAANKKETEKETMRWNKDSFAYLNRDVLGSVDSGITDVGSNKKEHLRQIFRSSNISSNTNNENAQQ